MRSGLGRGLCDYLDLTMCGADRAATVGCRGQRVVHQQCSLAGMLGTTWVLQQLAVLLDVQQGGAAGREMSAANKIGRYRAPTTPACSGVIPFRVTCDRQDGM